MSKTII